MSNREERGYHVPALVSYPAAVKPLFAGYIFGYQISIIQICFIQSPKGKQFIPEQTASLHLEISGYTINPNNNRYSGKDLVLIPIELLSPFFPPD